jgi:hypothetical protein
VGRRGAGITSAARGSLPRRGDHFRGAGITHGGSNEYTGDALNLVTRMVIVTGKDVLDLGCR